MGIKLKLVLISLVPITMLINLMAKRYSYITEKYYSTKINKITRQLLSNLTNIFPFSLGEFLVIMLTIFLLVFFVALIVSIRKRRFVSSLINLGEYISILYILFMFLWGFNYNRLSFDKVSGLEIRKSSKHQLYEVCEDLIKRANILRSTVKENSQGVMTIPGGYKNVFNRADEGYKIISGIYPELGGQYGLPKPILMSKWMSYTGITGIYMPYTGEANVNVNVTDFTLPATAMHEMAHQRGFAREDEANYIAYVVCTKHPDSDFQYSGVMLALVYATNALAKTDYDLYKELRIKYSEGVIRDLKYDAEFWNKYSGSIEKISDNMNDKYLKSNGQQDGVESYGRMIDLLIAEYNK